MSATHAQDEVAIFPLQTVLFPGAAMALQIFEPRYMDMVARCMREQSGFVIAQLLRGGEVFDRQQHADIEIGKTGTYATIQDWSSLENGRLGLVVAGTQRLTIGPCSEQSDHLLTANISLQDAEPFQAMPDDDDGMLLILDDLLRHPSVARLSIQLDKSNAVSVSNVLAQLLPIDPLEKYGLLLAATAIERLDKLASIIDQLRR